MNKIRVAIVDDQTLIREGLAALNLPPYLGDCPPRTIRSALERFITYSATTAGLRTPFSMRKRGSFRTVLLVGYAKRGIINPMSTKEKLTQSLKEAMKAKDVLRKRVARMALASIKNAEVEKRGELDEPGLLAILQKEVKARHETIEGARQAKRDDLIAEAEAEIAVLEEYLPKALSPEELKAIVQETIAETGAASLNEIGKVMGALMPKIRGRADGKEANQIARELLGQ